jgi:hypothetical protein
VYRQTLVPKDPYAVRSEHVDTVKKVVDDMIATLDSFLGGALSRDDWMHQDRFEMVYPPGANFSDLPADTAPKGPALPPTSSSSIGLR